MFKQLHFYTYLITIVVAHTFISCNKKSNEGEFVAYFGGEVINPESDFVLFLKDNEIVDTIFLDKSNRFMHKFDSLAPGLYTFKHLPEFQYVYFDKNDSLMVTINSKDFDNSIVFCGRGDEKNNFLMEMYLLNKKDRSSMFDYFAYDSPQFMKTIDTAYSKRKKIYEKHKQIVNWSSNFDSIAIASVDLPYFFKKEMYPYAHKFITGNNILNQIPENYYTHRTNVDFNNPNFANYHPYVNYVTAMLNNMAFSENKGEIDEQALENSIKKLNIADKLIKNNKNKNTVLNGLAMKYLLEDQNMYNTKSYINRYLELSTDKKYQQEIKDIAEHVQKLGVGKKLPLENFVDLNNQKVNLEKLISKKTVLFFCTTNAMSHMESVHKKAAVLKEKYPNINFIGINIDDSVEEWQKKLGEFNHKNIVEIHATDFEAIKENWVINKLSRTIILNADGTINNAFVNLFDINFEDNLNP